MKHEVVTKRYADAFVAYARASAPLDAIMNDIRYLKRTIRDNVDFMAFLENMAITINEKISFLAEVLKDDILPETKHLCDLLLKRHRIGLLPDILECVRLHYSEMEKKNVVLRSAYLIDDDMMRALTKTIEYNLGKCKFYLGIDGELLGGIQIIMDNKVIDCSIKKRLDDIRRKLMTTRV